jgi:radical SAM superfamily enzyme YgiQ (UPF0313 family)
MIATESATIANQCAESLPKHPVHGKGARARVLLTSVFGPYAKDDEFGSRAINPMELYHNQVTRVQRGFSLRMFHRSWGIKLIQENIDAPTTLLDFPTRERFIEEIASKQYDVVGITSIIPNVAKVAHMCELIRQHLPDAQILIGGHVANLPDLAERIDADHIVRGEGVRWMRLYLGQDPDGPIKHPYLVSGLGTRSMGLNVKDKPGDVAATLIPSVGCPMGCNFCSTSAMFGGKGKCYHFYETGDELYEVMCDLERNMRVRSFFVMDENFLLHRKRALRLLELMQQGDKAWALYVFSSANVLKSYSIDQLVGLGISWIWMGLEGENSSYSKLKRANTKELVGTLQSHGIRVLGSTIIGLEEHTPENIDKAIDYAVDHDTEFHQFMLYTAVAGTPLHAERQAAGDLLDNEQIALEDTHGQFHFNFKHSNITDGRENEFLLRAFQRDFEVNGPSIVRIIRTTLEGWKRHKNDLDRRVRRRFKWESRDLAVSYSACLWAARRWYRRDKPMLDKISRTLKDLHKELGFKARLMSPVAGRFVYRKLKREARRLSKGWTYEPPTFYEHNAAAAAGAHTG